jgi:hypothetical protein
MGPACEYRVVHPPATVWLARPEDPRTRPGTLAVGEGRLTFAAEDGERIGVALDELEGVRRLRGTPVLEVRSTRGVLLFYFSEPPPLAVRSGDLRPGQRRMRRMAAIRALRTANRRCKPTIERWVRAIREG